jgi:hypothetical protein
MPESRIDWDLINNGCPVCRSPAAGPENGYRGQLNWHSLTVWCNRCGWGRNWEDLRRRTEL